MKPTKPERLSCIRCDQARPSCLHAQRGIESDLRRRRKSPRAQIDAELARKFVGFSDVLADVSERTGLTSNNDLLRLYEKWLRTGSERDGQRLIQKGILPNSSIGKRFIQ